MKAPALEKGLDVLEVLVAESEAMTLSQIANRCDRTVSEIQRMVHVLQQRGYLERTETNAYRPGLKLYELGRFRHPFRHLQSIAEPVMAQLAQQTGHSIHLSVEDRGQMLILSEILGSGVAAVALKVGSRHPLEDTLSGRILLLNDAKKGRAADRRKIDESGFLEIPSPLYSGVQDIGVPIRRDSDGRILGVLACGWLKRRGEALDSARFAKKLSKAAGEVSKNL